MRRIATASTTTQAPHGSFADRKTEQAEYLDVCSFTAVPETGYMVDTVSATYVNEAGETIAIELIPGAKTIKDHAGTTGGSLLLPDAGLHR